jgi:hypothetical protein
MEKLGARVNRGEGIGVKEQTGFVGVQWIEWRVDQVANLTQLSQTVFFCPHGLPGFLYWFLFYPFHMWKFRGLIRKIKDQSETE